MSHNSITIILPENVKLILRVLNENGYEAYVVGGCVRDSILGNTPKDWDICTSALPEIISLLFRQYELVLSGIKHGTVGVIIDNIVYEITTYRIDGNYTDSRHPDEIRFVNNIKQDLSRRDFTINAMAYNESNGLIDPFLGLYDLKEKVIRCVGKPESRFGEDYLRVLRAVRFAVRYNFKIEPSTATEIKYFATKMRNVISSERVIKEISETLECSLIGQESKISLLLYCFECYYGVKLLSTEKAIGELINSPVCLAIRIAVIISNSDYRSEDYDSNIIQNKLKLSKLVSKQIEHILQYSNNIGVQYFSRTELIHNNENIPFCFLYLAYKIGKINASYVAEYLALHSHDSIRHQKLKNIAQNLMKIDELGFVYKVAQLNITGSDLISIGMNGTEIGVCLSNLLFKVMNNEINNSKEELLQNARASME